VESLDPNRFGQEEILLGAGNVPRPAGLLGPGPATTRNPYPVYGDGVGIGVGSASEEASGRGRCCGADLASSSAGPGQAAPLPTGSTFESTEPSRGDAFTDPLAPAAPSAAPMPSGQGGNPPRPPPPGGPGRFARSLFSVGPDCANAACEDVVRAGDWMVMFVPNGATWSAIPKYRTS
jgi:hypothetical protein